MESVSYRKSIQGRCAGWLVSAFIVPDAFVLFSIFFVLMFYVPVKAADKVFFSIYLVILKSTNLLQNNSNQSTF